MTTDTTEMRRSSDLLSHLNRFPEDLRDIRRLQRRFGLSSAEVAAALDAWRTADGAGRRLEEMRSH